MVITLVLVAGTFAAKSADWYQTGDFQCLYSGSRALITGNDPYDTQTWPSLTGGPYPVRRTGLVSYPPCPGRFGYPLWTAVMLLPLGVLPIEVASSAWMSISIGLFLIGLRASWRAFGGSTRFAALFAVSVVMSQPFWIVLLSGQIGAITFGLAAMSVAAVAYGRDAVGGALLSLLAVKPQVCAVTLPAVLADAFVRRRNRFVAAAVGVGLAMLVAPTLLNPQWPVEWLSEVGSRRLRVISDLPTAWGLGAHVLGDPVWGLAILSVVIVATLLIARPGLDRVTVFVLTIPLSLLATPYAWTYDYLILAIPWAYLYATAATSKGLVRPALVLVSLTVAVLLPWLFYAASFTRGDEAVSSIVAIGTLLAAALTARFRATAIRRDAPLLADQPA